MLERPEASPASLNADSASDWMNAMFLTVDNLAHYLLARGRVTPDDIVSGDFVALEAGRRNRNFKVFLRDRAGLFIKQVSTATAEMATTLHREAACYQLAQENPNFSALRGHVPRLLDYDPKRHTLTVELVKDGESLNEYHSRVRAFPESVGLMQARLIASQQREAARMMSTPADLALFPRMRPWLLSLTENAELMASSLSPGQWRLVQILRQTPELRRGLAALAASWQVNSLIHVDVKWDNFLLFRNSEGQEALWLVDWELADFGDAAWDAACVLAAYLQFWVFSVPVDPSQADPAVMIPHAPYRLEMLWPAVRAFWREYVRQMGLTSPQAAHHFTRCVMFAGARLVLTCFEMHPATYSGPGILPQGTLCLRLASALFSDPLRAGRELLGLGLDSMEVQP